MKCVQGHVSPVNSFPPSLLPRSRFPSRSSPPLPPQTCFIAGVALHCLTRSTACLTLSRDHLQLPIYRAFPAWRGALHAPPTALRSHCQWRTCTCHRTGAQHRLRTLSCPARLSRKLSRLAQDGAVLFDMPGCEIRARLTLARRVLMPCDLMITTRTSSVYV